MDKIVRNRSDPNPIRGLCGFRRERPVAPPFPNNTKSTGKVVGYRTAATSSHASRTSTVNEHALVTGASLQTGCLRVTGKSHNKKEQFSLVESVSRDPLIANQNYG